MLEQARRRGRLDAGGADVVLERDRDAEQRRIRGRARGRAARGAFQRPAVVHVQEGVQVARRAG